MSEQLSQNVSTKDHISTLVLANIAEVTAVLTQIISGDDISTALNGETLSKEMLGQLAMSIASSEITQNSAVIQ